MKLIAALSAALLALTPALAAADDAKPVPTEAALSGQTTGGVANKSEDDDDKLGFIVTPEGVALGALALGAVAIIALIAAQNGDNNAATNTN